MEIKGLLIDLDGTLYVGGSPVEGAHEALARLRDAGLLLRYVTNTTRMPRRAVHEHLLTLGFDMEETEIITPARTVEALIRGQSCFPLVDKSLLEDLGDVVLTQDSPDFVLIGDIGEEFGYANLNATFRHLMDGADLLALQKNRYWRREDGLSLDAGPFVAALEYASGKSATIVGKPEQRFFELALREMGLKFHEAAMVGDDPEADVVGARRAGLEGIQVRTGKYSPETESAEANLVIDCIADLPEALRV
jgi:HAD superfamily hydrolase (TIGR01458 family)